MAREPFRYYGEDRTEEDLDQQARSSAFDSIFNSQVKVFKPREGENCVRILPPGWNDIQRWGKFWSISTFVHYDVGPDNGSYLCLDKMLGKPCPVCDARREAERGGDDDEAKELRPVEAPVAYVIDRENERLGPQIWRMPQSKVKVEIVLRSKDKQSGRPLLIDSPGPPHTKEMGYDIVFFRSGKDKKTSYTGVDILRQGTPLHDDPDIQQDWLDYIVDHPVPDQLVYYSAEHIENVLYGRGAAEERRTSRSERRETDAGGTRRDRRATFEDDRTQASRPARGAIEDQRSNGGGEPPWDDQRPIGRYRREDRGEPASDRTASERPPERAERAAEPAEEGEAARAARDRLDRLREQRRAR